MVKHLRQKIIGLVAVLLLAAIVMSGCFLYDESVGDNIGPFVDPLNNPSENFLPDGNAKKAVEIPLEETKVEGNAADDGIVVIDDNHIRLTSPTIVEAVKETGEEGKQNVPVYYFERDGFRFEVPFLWRKTMVVDVIKEVDDGHDLTYYVFSYVPADQSVTPPMEAKVMTIRISPYDHYTDYRHSNSTKEEEGVSPIKNAPKRDDGNVYTLLKPTEGILPDDFPDVDGYLSILKVLGENLGFQRIGIDDVVTGQ